MAKFHPCKGFNTRAGIAAVEAPYVICICQGLREKLEAEWSIKWYAFGNSLQDCCHRRKFSEFIRALRKDIFSIFKSSSHPDRNSNITISEPTLKRLLKSDRPADFLQEHIRERLAVYLGFQSWEDFKSSQSLLPSLQPSTKKAAETSESVSELMPVEVISGDFFLKPQFLWFITDNIVGKTLNFGRFKK